MPSTACLVAQIIPDRLLEWAVGGADRPRFGHVYGRRLDPVSDTETNVTNCCDRTNIPAEMRSRPGPGRRPAIRDDLWMDRSEFAVRAALDRIDVGYEIVPCDPALADTAAFCEAYGYAPEDSANTIVVLGKSDPPRYAACVVLATTRLDVNRVVRARLGVRKASFADADQTRAQTGMEIGGVTAIGLPPDLPVWVDSRVMHRSRIVLGGGSRSCKVVGPPAILTAQPGIEVVEGLAVEVPGAG